MDQNRKTLFENLDRLIEVVSEDKNNKKLGQNSLFDVLKGQNPIQQNFNYQAFKEYSYSELLEFEKELLGFYVSGHPLDPYKKAINSFSSLNVLKDLATKKDSIIQFSGILNSVKVIQTKRNNAKMAFGVIEDFKGAIDIVVFTESYERYRDFLIEGNVIGVIGRLTFNRDKFSIVVEKVVNIERLSENKVKNIHIKFLNNKLNDLQLLNSLKESISNFEDNSGFSNIYFYLRENGKDLKLKMNSILNFVPDEDKLDKLRRCVIVEDVWVD